MNSSDSSKPLQVLTVRAVDGDRGIRNEIRYALSGANQNLFGINPQTGEIYTKVKEKERHIDRQIKRDRETGGKT